MKKAKIFLAAIIIFSSVGGVLASKVKFAGLSYCTMANFNQPPTEHCTSFITNLRFEAGDNFRYSQTNNTAGCGEVHCPNTGDLAPE